MATKTPYCNEELPTLRFPWALKVSNFSELLLVSGHADVKHDNSTANGGRDGGQVLQSHIPLLGLAQRLPTPRLVNRPT